MSFIPSEILYSARTFAKNPGLTIALLITIGLGLGSNIAVSGFIDGLVARRSPIAKKDRVVSLFRLDRHRASGPLSYEEYLRIKGSVREFERIGAARVSQRVVGFADRSAAATVGEVTPDFARLFHLSLDGGVVISRRLWQREFHGDPQIAGETIQIGGARTHVLGVGPEDLEGIYRDRPIDVWKSLDEASIPDSSRGNRNLWVLAGLQAGASIKTILRDARLTSGEVNMLPFTGMTPETAEGVGHVRILLRLAAGAVFFIACVNVAALLLGRATARWHANSIRVALGVSRARLAGAILSDSLGISLAGGAVSVVLGVWTSQVLPALLFDQDADFLVLAPNVLSIVTAATLGISVTIASGLLPLLEIRHDRPALVLSREGRGLSAATRTVSAILILAQMACCCFLVICTGLLWQGFRAALRTAGGQRVGQSVLAMVHVQPALNVDLRYFWNVERAARSLPGVSNATWAARPPGSRPATRSFRFEPRGLPLRDVQLDLESFTSDLVPQFSWPPKAGRSFALRDQGCRVALVDEAAAKTLFGDNTVGRSIQDAAGNPVEIIGELAMRKTSAASRSGRPTIYYDETRPTGHRLETGPLARFTAPSMSRLEIAEVDTNVVSPGYFAAMGFSVVAGRAFSEERIAQGCRVAVVNEELADSYFAGDAVGGAVIDELGQRSGIIGIVHSPALGSFQRTTEPTVYFPMAQDCLSDMTLTIEAKAADGPMLSAVQQTLEGVPGRGPGPPSVKTLETQLSQTALAPLRIATVLIGACAATALFLGILGLYATLNDAARIGRRNLAIRMALGARRRDVIRNVLQNGAQMAAGGILGGVLGSLLLSKRLSEIGAHATAQRMWVWILGPVVVAAAVAIAGVLPVGRALMADPLQVLRRE